MGKELYNGGIFGGRSREEVYNQLVNTRGGVHGLEGSVYYRVKYTDEETRVNGHFEIKIRKDLIDQNDPGCVVSYYFHRVHAIAVAFGKRFKDGDMRNASLRLESILEEYDICKFSNSYYSFFGKLSFEEFVKFVSDLDKEIKSGRIGVIDPVVEPDVIRHDQLSDEDVKGFIDKLACDMLRNMANMKDFLIFSNKILSLYAKIEAGTISFDVRGIENPGSPSSKYFKEYVSFLWECICYVFCGCEVTFGFRSPGDVELNQLLCEHGKDYGRTKHVDKEVDCKTDPIRVSKGTEAPKELETFSLAYDHPHNPVIS